MLLKSTLSKKSLRKLIEKSMRKFGKTEEEFEKNEKVEGIPDICHFFTQSNFLEKKIYTEKRQFFALNL